VLFEVKAGIGVATIDRPPVNALDTATYVEIEEIVTFVSAQPQQCRVLVLAAAGERAFSAGADIKEFGSFLEPGKGFEMANRIHQIHNRLEGLPIATIAAIEAAALGGGCELILACDLRVAGEEARFGFPELHVGQFPGTGGTMRLPWLIGESRAKELALTGEPISARRALEIGLIHRVVKKSRALPEAMAWAQELAQLPGSGIAAVKESISGARTGSVEERSLMDAQLSEAVFRSPDAVEGFRAFVEKRPPNFGSTSEGEMK
jgi:enoyl-CoA hydratase/carnithine racemase